MLPYWRWLFLVLLLRLSVPQIAPDLNPCYTEECNELHPGEGPLEFSRPDTTSMTLGNLADQTREKDSIYDDTGESDNLCISSNNDISAEVDRLSMGNISSHRGGEDDLFFGSSADFIGVLVLVRQQMRAYFLKLITHFPEEWQPGHNFYTTAMFIAAATEAVIILALTWQRVLTVKNRMNQLTEKQLKGKLAQLRDEKHSCEVKLTNLKNIVQEHEHQNKRLQTRLSSSQGRNKELKESVKEMQGKLEGLNTVKDVLDAIIKEREKNESKTTDHSLGAKNQTHNQKEMDLQQNLERGEHNWRAKVAKVYEELNDSEKSMKGDIHDIIVKLDSVELLFKARVQEFNEQYMKTLTLMSELEFLTEENEHHQQEDIAEKTKKSMDEVWLKEVVRNGEFIKEPIELSLKSDSQNQSQG